MAAESPFYDLFRDASDNANALADALRQTIVDFSEQHDDVTDKEIADAIKMVSLKTKKES